MKYVINVDWLQVFCQRDLIEMPEVITVNDRTCTLTRLDHYTSLWLEVYSATIGDNEVATICRCPRSSAMKQSGMTIKLHNRVLYSQQWYSILQDIMRELGCIYVGITRLDVCLDCNELYGGRSVHSLLFDYIAHTPFIEGHIIRSGSRNVTVNMVRNKMGATRIKAMRWGTKNADVGAYCYDKTLEMMEVKNKPWIVKEWERAGLVSEYDRDKWDKLTNKERDRLIELGSSADYVLTPVWRFEISIKAHGKDILNINTGELFKLSMDSIDTKTKIEWLFQVYANKYFDFRINQGVARLRDYTPMQIFEFGETVECRPYSYNRSMDTGRIEKIAERVLERVQDKVSDMTPEMRKSIENVRHFLRVITGCKEYVSMMKREQQHINNMIGSITEKDIYQFYYANVEWSCRNRMQLYADNHWQNIKSLIAASIDYEHRMAAESWDSELSPVW